MPKPLSVSAATMPAIQVPWPFGSVSGVRAVKGGPAGQDDAIEVGVGGLDAGVEDRDGRRAGDGRRAVELVPADLGQRPLVGVGGVGRGGSGVANSIGLDAEHLRRGDQGGELGADGVGVEGDAADRELRDGLDVGGAGRVEDLELARRGRAGGEGDQVRDWRRRRGSASVSAPGLPQGSAGVGSGVGSGVAAGVGSGVASGVGSAVGSASGPGVGLGRGRLRRARLGRRVFGQRRRRPEDVRDEDEQLEHDESGPTRSASGTRWHWQFLPL